MLNFQYTLRQLTECIGIMPQNKTEWEIRACKPLVFTLLLVGWHLSSESGRIGCYSGDGVKGRQKVKLWGWTGENPLAVTQHATAVG